MKKQLPWEIILDWGWILAVTAASSLIFYAAWRESGPFDSPDIRTHQANAIEFIRNGVIPYRGQGLSYSGWGPPGTSFLMIPGVLLFSDPRLAEVPGAVLLHLGLLAFLFFLARDTIGRVAAWAAVPLAGFLPLVGPSLWPNGHPFFVAGMAYFLVRWVRGRSPHMFSAAFLLAGLGMYVYFTLAPALVAMLVIALVFRPPISLRSLATVLLLLFLIWLPYLNFEAGRGFVDIGSMILRRDLETGAAQTTADVDCYATLPGETDFQEWNYLPWTAEYDANRMVYAGTGRLASLTWLACTLFNKLDRNFDSGYFLFGDPAWPTGILFGAYLTGWMILFLCWIAGWKPVSGLTERLRAAPLWRFLLGGGIGAGILILISQPALVGAFLPGDSGAYHSMALLLGQVRAYGILVWVSGALALPIALRRKAPVRETGVLAITIGVCGGLLWALSELERSWRFYWFWPLQSVAVAAALDAVVRSAKPRRWLPAAAVLLVILFFFPYRSASSKMESIVSSGYGGRESGQVEAMAWLASAAERRPSQTVRIGVVRLGGEGDPTRAWGWLEFGLKYVYESPNAAVAGQGPQDDYRVVEFLGADQDAHPDPCPWDGYELAWEGRRYAICARR
ncbi:MAG: hypothetical protein JW929_03700 [Anaerolineales bacterium]|nr:hypothetical protein [Anaerolineales bacterium]